jgi:uncharacterized protein (TIGR03086 family)
MGRPPDVVIGAVRHHGGVPHDPTPDVTALIVAGRDREAARRGAGLEPPAPGTAHHTPLAITSLGGPMDALTQFAQLGPALGGVIGTIGPDDLDAPTLATQLTVRGVLEHMIAGGTMFAAAYRGVAPTAPDLRDPIAGIQRTLGDLGAAVSAPGALERTIESPFGTMDGESFARYVVLDGLVHGWDLATALGREFDPPPAVVAAAMEFAERTIDAWRDGTTFAAAAPADPDASPLERLVAYTGRRVQGRVAPAVTGTSE